MRHSYLTGIIAAGLVMLLSTTDTLAQQTSGHLSNPSLQGTEETDKDEFYRNLGSMRKTPVAAPESSKKYHSNLVLPTRESVIEKASIRPIRENETFPEKSALSAPDTYLPGLGGGCEPSNDHICGAETLTLGVPAAFDNTCATVDGGEPVPGPGSNSCTSQDGWCPFELELQNTVWFSFTAPASTAVTISSTFDFYPYDTQLALYGSDGECFENLTLLAANDDYGNFDFSSYIYSAGCLTPGQTYYVQVDGYAGLTGTGSVVVNESFVFTPDIFIMGSPVLCPGSPTYLFVQYYTSGGVIEWSNGETGQMIEITEPGDYSVTVDCATSAYSVTLAESTGPANDNICNAQQLTLNYPSTFNNTCATVEPGEPSPGVGTASNSCTSQDGWCGSDPFVQNSVWFKFNTPPSKAVILSSTFDNAPYDTQLALWAAPNGCGGPLTLLAANDDKSGNDFSSGIGRVYCLQPNSTYYVQVDGYQGTQGSGRVVVTAVPNSVTICHRTAQNNLVTLTVSGCALPAHLAHGDQIGGCGNAPRSAMSEEEELADQILSVYPNPSGDVMNVSFYSENEEMYSIQLIDLAGKVVLQETRTSVEGTNLHQLNLIPFATGVYTLVLRQGDVSNQTLILKN